MSEYSPEVELLLQMLREQETCLREFNIGKAVHVYRRKGSTYFGIAIQDKDLPSLTRHEEVCTTEAIAIRDRLNELLPPEPPALEMGEAGPLMSPADAIRFVFEEKELDIAELLSREDVPFAPILAGTQRLTYDSAGILSFKTGVPRAVWLGLQANYVAHYAPGLVDPKHKDGQLVDMGDGIWAKLHNETASAGEPWYDIERDDEWITDTSLASNPTVAWAYACAEVADLRRRAQAKEGED